jgi:hypothetical protein
MVEALRWPVLVVLGAWALHWTLVDALDAGRVLRHGQSLAEAEAEDLHAPSPWFVRAVRRLEPGTRQRPDKGFSGFLHKYLASWRSEIAFIERHRTIALGFGLTTAALLAIPVLNLLFPPIIVVAAVHLLGCLESDVAADPTRL